MEKKILSKTISLKTVESEIAKSLEKVQNTTTTWQFVSNTSVYGIKDRKWKVDNENYHYIYF